MTRQEFINMIEYTLSHISEIEDKLQYIDDNLDNFVDSEHVSSKEKDKIDNHILSSFMDLDILEGTINNLKHILTK